MTPGPNPPQFNALTADTTVVTLSRVTESGTVGLGLRNGGSASVLGGVVDVEVA